MNLDLPRTSVAALQAEVNKCRRALDAEMCPLHRDLLEMDLIHAEEALEVFLEWGARRTRRHDDTNQQPET